MRSRKRHLPLLVGLAAIGALALGGAAQGQAPTAAIVASDFALPTIDGAAPNVTIPAGGNVDVSTPVGPPASALRVASSQRGVAVRGSVRVRSSGSLLLARIFARRGALVGGTSTREVAIGSSRRASVGPGRVAFSVSLDPGARRALRRNGRLAITLRLTVTQPGGGPYVATRKVVLRR